LADRRVAVRVRCVDGGGERVLDERTLELSEAGTARLVVALPAGTPAVAVELPDDALPADNRAVLLSAAPRPVAVAVRIRDDAVRRPVERALAAIGHVRLNAQEPQLVFADEAQAGAPYWQGVLVAPEAPRWVRGPYLADRSHALLEGVHVEGVMWAVGTNALPGRPLLLADASPLIALEASARQMPVVRMQVDRRMAPLFQSTAWPVLLWNIVQACAEAQPGPVSRNLRVGAPALFTLARGQTQAVFDTPAGARTVGARTERVTWTPDAAGLCRMSLPKGADAAFAVNLFAAGEADLRDCVTGTWAAAPNAERLQSTHRSYAWLAGILALALLALHQFLLAAKAKGGGPL
jgi:hypothetical protein